MSTPPNVPPSGYGVPGGGAYYQPPKSNSGGCWKAFGITCGVLVIAVIILIAIAVNAVKKGLAHPDKSTILGASIEVANGTKNGVEIVKALQRYHTHTGKYPNSLKDLVPDYLPDGKILHSDVDGDSSDIGHISYKYTKPAPDAPGDTPVLQYHYRMDIHMAGQEQSQDGTVIFNLNGTSSQSTTRQNGAQVHFGGGAPGSGGG